MSTTSMNSPAPFDTRSFTSWPASAKIHATTNTLSSIGQDPATMRTSMCYTPELEALPLLIQSPPTSAPTSVVGTPISPPASICNRHMYPIMNHAGLMTPPPIDPRLTSPFEFTADHLPHMPRTSLIAGSRRSPPCSSNQPFAEQDHEIAFLLQSFAEGPGYCMDLFDSGTYFASYVPVKAREDPLLRYAAVACAAKSLARVQGRKPAMRGNQARMNAYPDVQSVDWKHKAAIYYDHAVSLLLQALKTDTTALSDSECEYRVCSGNSAPKRRRTSSASSSSLVTDTDNLLAASAILCLYESLDSSVLEWAKHLNGAKSLLVMTQERRLSQQMSAPSSPTSSVTLNFMSKARRATFWNIARQDMIAAFINKTPTRLDTEDLSLWKEAGLLINDQGFVISSNTTTSGYSENGEPMTEDLICNTLVWLMAKLVNFMAAGDETPHGTGASWAPIPQRTLLDYWNHLQKQFQIWHDGLPATFRPAGRVDPPELLQRGNNEATFSEVWYSIPMCASTMQTYHMSQILLFMNKPHESTQGRSTVCARINSYQSVLSACQKHSREIVSISLAQSDEAACINSIQPLFTAGQCLSKPRERQVVVNLLRDVESNIGWATDYRVRQLVDQWQWEEHHHATVP